MGKISHLKWNFHEFLGEKTGYFFPCGAFLSHVVGECLLKFFQENSSALKNSWLRTHARARAWLNSYSLRNQFPFLFLSLIFFLCLQDVSKIRICCQSYDLIVAPDGATCIDHSTNSETNLKVPKNSMVRAGLNICLNLHVFQMYA